MDAVNNVLTNFRRLFPSVTEGTLRLITRNLSNRNTWREIQVVEGDKVLWKVEIIDHEDGSICREWEWIRRQCWRRVLCLQHCSQGPPTLGTELIGNRKEGADNSDGTVPHDRDHGYTGGAASRPCRPTATHRRPGASVPADRPGARWVVVGRPLPTPWP